MTVARLTKEEIVKLRLRLTNWQNPETMASLVEPIHSTTFHGQSGLAFLRDAWVAAEFASARKVGEVRLIPDNWPDFELRVDDKVERFEAVEADDPKRRRGLEYSEENIGKIEHDPVENWIARSEAAPQWIAIACGRKAAKNYAGLTNLVIYLSNSGGYGIRDAEVKASFPAATASIKDRFESVWILWQGEAYQVWLFGRPVGQL